VLALLVSTVSNNFAIFILHLSDLIITIIAIGVLFIGNCYNYIWIGSRFFQSFLNGEIGGTGDSWKQYAKSGDIILDLAGGLGGGVGAGLSGVGAKTSKVVGKIVKSVNKVKVLRSKIISPLFAYCFQLSPVPPISPSSCKPFRALLVVF
jgi:hypothetical protein